MKSISASKFKEKCLFLLDHLDPEGLIISKHGKPVARLLPVQKSSAEAIGSLKGKLEVKGDITTTGLKWDAQS
jgi:antitoxin (DNA-binding transcriptional repressor) of toxin-antitoxin stability system